MAPVLERGARGRGYILGLWDGHDAGVAAVDAETGEILVAINEERLTRRKLDVGFPRLGLHHVLDRFGPPTRIVVPTTDPAKVLTRLIPSAARRYYSLRRHKSRVSAVNPLQQAFKGWMTQLPPSPVSAFLTAFLTAWRADLGDVPVRTMDHHLAHLQGAWFTSGFARATVLSLDGIGDACSGAVALGDGAGLRVLARISGRDSIGLVYEEATRLLHMRELEDEGKVMALATYADLGDEDRGALLDLVTVEADESGLRLKGRADYRKRLRAELWRLGPERFAAAVQYFAETRVLEVAAAAVTMTGCADLAVAGGVFANVRINRRVREEVCGPAGGRLWVFPHMGDGGLALGAALHGPAAIDPYLGMDLDVDGVAAAAREAGLHVADGTLEDVVARLVAGQAIGWVNGRMEFGPRALGARSILARPDDRRIRDRLNLAQKKRVFYQPFCPTMLQSEATRSLTGYGDGAERWMTSLFGTRADSEARLQGVTGPDGSCRPQILPDDPRTPEETLYRELLVRVEAAIGVGAVLNTSFNVHGDPIVGDATDAVEGFLKSGLDALVAGGRILVTRPA